MTNVNAPMSLTVNGVFIEQKNMQILSEINTLKVNIDNIALKIDSMLGIGYLAPQYNAVLQDWKNKIHLLKCNISDLGTLFVQGYFYTIEEFGKFSEKVVKVANQLDQIAQNVERCVKGFFEGGRKVLEVCNDVVNCMSTNKVKTESIFLNTLSYTCNGLCILGSSLSKMTNFISYLFDDKHQYYQRINDKARFSSFFEKLNSNLAKMRDDCNQSLKNAIMRKGSILDNPPTIREPEDFYQRFQPQNIIKNSIAIQGCLNDGIHNTISFNLFDPNKLLTYKIFIGKYKNNDYQIGILLGKDIFDMDNQLKKEFKKGGGYLSVNVDKSKMNCEQRTMGNIIDAVNKEFIKNNFSIDKMYEYLEKDYHTRLTVVNKNQNVTKNANFYVMQDNLDKAQMMNNGKISVQKNIESAGYGYYPVNLDMTRSEALKYMNK